METKDLDGNKISDGMKVLGLGVRFDWIWFKFIWIPNEDQNRSFFSQLWI